MSRKSKMQSVREAKDKRAKKLAIGGAVLLVAVLAFEVPHVMKKSGGSSSAPPAPTATTPATGVPATAPTTAQGTAAAASLPATSTKLPNSDTLPARSKATLYSFSHFSGKDPFVQQVSAADITNTPSMGSGGSSGKSGGAANNSGATVAPTAAVTPGTSVRTLAQSGAVRIRVNGAVQTVRVGASFPSSNPLFKLVSVSNGVVKIGIANGSYASGAGTVALTRGRALTLVDQSDGVRYKLELLSAS